MDAIAEGSAPKPPTKRHYDLHFREGPAGGFVWRYRDAGDRALAGGDGVARRRPAALHRLVDDRHDPGPDRPHPEVGLFRQLPDHLPERPHADRQQPRQLGPCRPRPLRRLCRVPPGPPFPPRRRRQEAHPLRRRDDRGAPDVRQGRGRSSAGRSSSRCRWCFCCSPARSRRCSSRSAARPSSSRRSGR